MNAPAPLHAQNTVRAAYAALFNNIGAFTGLALLWLALWIAFNLATPTLAALAVQTLPGAELEDAELLLEAFGQLVLQGIAIVSVCIAWHRFIILEEPLRSPFPNDVGIVLSYAWRTILFMLFPAALMILVLLSAFNSADISIDSIPATVLVQLTESAAVAALVRAQIAFPAAAIGERDPTFTGSWTLTRGNTLPLITGILACDLPFTLLATGVEAGTLTTETQTVEDYLATSVLIVIEFMRAAVVAAFLSYAYVHFTRADAPNRPPASHFG